MQWLKRSAQLVRIVATDANADAQLLLAADPLRKRRRGLGEASALEVVNDQSLAYPDTKSILLYEDSDVLGMRLVRPEAVDTLTTSDFLYLLEEARLIQSADQILDAAIAAGRPQHVRRATPDFDPRGKTELVRDDKP